MLKQKLICDMCGKEIPMGNDVEKGGFVILKREYDVKDIKRGMTGHLEKKTYDLCGDCAQKVEQFIINYKKNEKVDK